MSHFTRLKTRLADKEHLLAALTDLGYSHQEGSVQIRGYGGNLQAAEIKVATSSPGYDIGFARGDEGYELVADWWGIRDISQEELVAALTRRYAYHASVASLGREGFALVSEETEAGGQIHLVLRRVA